MVRFRVKFMVSLRFRGKTRSISRAKALPRATVQARPRPRGGLWLGLLLGLWPGLLLGLGLRLQFW